MLPPTYNRGNLDDSPDAQELRKKNPRNRIFLNTQTLPKI